jgi:dienelactone hydrolase
MAKVSEQRAESVEIPFNGYGLQGELVMPANSLGIVLFAHGSGSSRHSPRNQFVAGTLRARRMGTMLLDLLTEEEEKEDWFRGHLRFDISLLAERLMGAANWVQEREEGLGLGYFGSSTGAAAALVATAGSTVPVKAIVSRGGRPDLADAVLPKIKAPTLLIVGSEDTAVIAMNQKAYVRLNCEKELKLVPGATHLFEEPGALEQVAEMAGEWFHKHFREQG